MNLRLSAQGEPLYSEAQLAQLGRRFVDLVCIVARLRKECPWDRKQTTDSFKRYVLEEAYEVLDAIERRNWSDLCEELGDFLFQAVFLAELAAEAQHFDMHTVLVNIGDKMVRRHPHVFEGQQVSEQDIARNWELLKQKELVQKKDTKETATSLFDGFTRGLPALLESYKIGKRAGKVGFDWPEPDQVLAKIEEEIKEIQEAQAGRNRQELQEELGDLLFAVSNLVRKHGFEPEETLRAANRKFEQRFRCMEALAREDLVDFAALDLETQETYWQRAKQRLKDEKGAEG